MRTRPPPPWNQWLWQQRYPDPRRVTFER